MKKQHIAFLPSSGMGHIIPLFQLAKKLLLRRFHVTFIVITTNASAAQNQFLNSPAVQLLPDFTVINLPPADVSAAITADMRIATQLSILTRESLKPLKPTLVDLNPDSLIIDIFTTDAIDVCSELSIPVYSFFTASSTLLTFSLYLPALDREVEGEYVDLPAPVEVPGCRPIRIQDLLDQVKDRKNDDYKWFLHHVSRLPRTSGIILNSWDDLEPDRLTALKENRFFKSIPVPPVYPVGPLVKDGEVSSEDDAEVFAWLDSQPRDSVLYVSFGSGGGGGVLSSMQLTELALALEASQQRFILVARRPVDGASASPSYFSVGSEWHDPSSYLPDGFVDRTRGVGVVITDWAPQQAVLRHPSTGAFISHCGWNSTLESLVEGVPMIAWPLYTAQRMNAAVVAEEVGVAVRVAAGEGVIGREEIEKVVREVMEGEKGKAIRLRAREVRETAREAVEDGGSSDLALTRFMDKIDGQDPLFH